MSCKSNPPTYSNLITYEDNTYINLWRLVKKSPFDYFIFIGGRGIGKTFSILRGLLIEDKTKFIYMRNTDEDIRQCMTKDDNPFKDINDNFGTDFIIGGMQKSPVIINNETDETVGLAKALSVSGKVRGSSFNDIEYIIYDEFISYGLVKSAFEKKKSRFLFNFIETVNRNRENKGGKPVKVIMIANAQTLDDDIIRSLRIGDVFYDMITNDRHYTEIPERNLFIGWLESSKKFVDMKSKQSLYQLTKGTQFYEMAINNMFTMDYFGDIAKIDYRELQPLVGYENVYFYTHKSKNLLFASYRKCNAPYYNEITFKAFRKDYGMILGNAIERGNILYYSYNCKLDALNIF